MTDGWKVRPMAAWGHENKTVRLMNGTLRIRVRGWHAFAKLFWSPKRCARNGVTILVDGEPLK